MKIGTMETLKARAKKAGVRLTKDVKSKGVVKRVDKTADQLRADLERTKATSKSAKPSSTKKPRKSGSKSSTARGGGFVNDVREAAERSVRGLVSTTMGESQRHQDE